MILINIRLLHWLGSKGIWSRSGYQGIWAVIPLVRGALALSAEYRGITDIFHGSL